MFDFHLYKNYNNLNLDFIVNTYKCVFNASILFNQNLDEIKEQIFKKISYHLYTLLRDLTGTDGRSSRDYYEQHTIIKEELVDNRLVIYVGNVLTLYDTQFDGVFDDIDEFLYAEII